MVNEVYGIVVIVEVRESEDQRGEEQGESWSEHIAEEAERRWSLKGYGQKYLVVFRVP